MTYSGERTKSDGPNQQPSLIGRQIGPWQVIRKREGSETGSRAVYVVQHRDGTLRGFPGWRLNKLMQEAKTGGLT